MSDPVPPTPQQGPPPAAPPVPPVAPPTYGAPGYPQPGYGPNGARPQYGAPGYPPSSPNGGSAWAQQPPVVARPLRGIGAATRGLVLASGALSLITVLVDGWGFSAVQAFSSGRVGIESLNAYDSVSAPLSLLSLAVLVAAGICWVVWQYRAASSLPQGSLRRSPGWHVGSWFIPIIAMWFPFQNISDIARSSRASLSGGLRGSWWALWVIASIFSNLAGQLLLRAQDIDSLSAALAMSVVSEALLVPAAVLASIVVVRITDAIDPARG